MVKIEKSDFKEYFNTSDLKETFQLSKTEAEQVWKLYIDADYKPYHKLDSSHWVNSKVGIIVGDWIGAYNNDNYMELAEVLDSQLNWNLNDMLYFIISRYFVIQTSWCDFKNTWINFLMCDDESPVLLNQCNVDFALVFNPIGTVEKKKIK